MSGDRKGSEADLIVLDCLGQRCPLPVIALAKRMRTAEIGDTVRVLADDPAAANDIPAWCRLTAQEFVGAQGPAFDVRKVS